MIQLLFIRTFYCLQISNNRFKLLGNSEQQVYGKEGRIWLQIFSSSEMESANAAKSDAAGLNYFTNRLSPVLS